MTLWFEPEAPMPSGLDDEAVAHLLALSQLPHIGPAALVRCAAGTDLARTWQLVQAGRAGKVAALVPALGVKDPRAREAEMAAAAQGPDPAALLARNRRAGRVLVYGAPGYPVRLLADPEPPAILFAVGDLAPLDGPVVAVVGTRNATQAGREMAIELGADLARAGVSVVSGLALGIDGAVHTGVLAARSGPAPDSAALGRPIAVIASGIDVAYPRRHATLHRQVAGAGCLLSETPLGLRPLPWRFPARNRIIAGLADAVVVVESRSAGGSMLTAADALARDVAVLAVPGHPRIASAAGANDLIADGAMVVRDVGDVLVAIGRGGTEEAAVPVLDPRAGMTSDQRAVLDALGVEPLALDEVVERVGRSLEDTSATLTELEADGRVARTGSWFQCIGAPANTTGHRR